ncbi:hypothetical protein BVX95_00170 [archaeon D22]|nr:hypothetical protein BVX95_00170 [archaeon D22]
MSKKEIVFKIADKGEKYNYYRFLATKKGMGTNFNDWEQDSKPLHKNELRTLEQNGKTYFVYIMPLTMKDAKQYEQQIQWAENLEDFENKRMFVQTPINYTTSFTDEVKKQGLYRYFPKPVLTINLRNFLLGLQFIPPINTASVVKFYSVHRKKKFWRGWELISEDIGEFEKHPDGQVSFSIELPKKNSKLKIIAHNQNGDAIGESREALLKMKSFKGAFSKRNKNFKRFEKDLKDKLKGAQNLNMRDVNSLDPHKRDKTIFDLLHSIYTFFQNNPDEKMRTYAVSDVLHADLKVALVHLREAFRDFHQEPFDAKLQEAFKNNYELLLQSGLLTMADSFEPNSSNNESEELVVTGNGVEENAVDVPANDKKQNAQNRGLVVEKKMGLLNNLFNQGVELEQKIKEMEKLDKISDYQTLRRYFYQFYKMFSDFIKMERLAKKMIEGLAELEQNEALNGLNK